jgi:hypothetical protein
VKTFKYRVEYWRDGGLHSIQLYAYDVNDAKRLAHYWSTPNDVLVERVVEIHEPKR